MGDTDPAFAAFVAERGGDLLRFGYLLCGERARAEDVVQDGLLKMLRHVRGNGMPEHPFAYSRRVIVNEYLAWRRRRSSTEVLWLDPDDRGHPDSSDAVADRDLVWRLIETLPDRARAVLVLRYYEQLPDAEIADWLGCAEATVRSIASRAFATLRENPQLDSLAPGLRKEA